MCHKVSYNIYNLHAAARSLPTAGYVDLILVGILVFFIRGVSTMFFVFKQYHFVNNYFHFRN